MDTIWTIEARKLACLLTVVFKDQSRGPLDKCTAVYGIDAYPEDEKKVQLEWELIQQGLRDRGLTRLAGEPRVSGDQGPIPPGKWDPRDGEREVRTGWRGAR